MQDDPIGRSKFMAVAFGTPGPRLGSVYMLSITANPEFATCVKTEIGRSNLDA